MTRLYAIAAAVLILAVGGYYYFFHYPPKVMERKVKQSLNDFSAAVATKDRTKIAASLQKFLADKAHIRLEVHLPSLSQQEPAPTVQDFEKPAFLSFIDNILYSMQDYQYKPQLQSFHLDADGKAAVTFTSKEWADGASYDAGIGTSMRFSSETTCDGHVEFNNGQPALSDAVCRIQLSIGPKTSK